MSETSQQHREHLKQVFQRLATHSLSINLSKSILGKTEVEFLGYTINEKGYIPNAQRDDKILDYPKPKTVVERK